MLRRHRRTNSAFTLIEILIVVVILGILAAIIIPQFAESAESAQDSAARSSLRVVRGQVELYKFNNGGENPTFTDLENGYLVDFEQPAGFCITIDASGEVTMAPGDCP